MSTQNEKTFISQFSIHPNGCIDVRKTTEVVDGDSVISLKYWRTTLVPGDARASTVLNEVQYANLAEQAWTPEVIAAYQAQMAALRP